MPRPKKPRKRLSLELSQEARKRLEALRDRTDADSPTEVIRKPLVLYDQFWSELEADGKIVIKHDSKDDERSVETASVYENTFLPTTPLTIVRPGSPRSSVTTPDGR